MLSETDTFTLKTTLFKAKTCKFPRNNFEHSVSNYIFKPVVDNSVAEQFQMETKRSVGESKHPWWTPCVALKNSET